MGDDVRLWYHEVVVVDERFCHVAWSGLAWVRSGLVCRWYLTTRWMGWIVAFVWRWKCLAQSQVLWLNATWNQPIDWLLWPWCNVRHCMCSRVEQLRGRCYSAILWVCPVNPIYSVQEAGVLGVAVGGNYVNWWYWRRYFV